MMKGQTYHDSDLLLDESGGLVGHSVGLCLNLKDSKYGRKAGSGCCEYINPAYLPLQKLNMTFLTGDGAAKTQYWIDPVTGVAASLFLILLYQSVIPPESSTYLAISFLLYRACALPTFFPETPIHSYSFTTTMKRLCTRPWRQESSEQAS
jgi:hypothetical protein